MSSKKNKQAKKKAEQKQVDKKRSFFTKEEKKYLTIILAAGLLLRLIYIFETSGTPFFQNLFSDSQIYSQWAKGIVSTGNWFGGDVFFMSPAYPYFLAFIYLIFGPSFFLVRIIQALISTATIFFIYLAGRNLYSKNAGYLAASIAAIYSIFIFYSGAILSETLQTFFVTLLFYFITKPEIYSGDSFNRETLKTWGIAGLLLGVSALFRANILLFYFAAAGWLILRYRKSEKLKKFLGKAVLYFSIGTALPVFLVAVRNYAVSGDLVLLTSNGGINFYLGNNKDANGIFKTPEDFDFYGDMSGKDYAEKITGKKLSSSAVSDYWYGRGLDYIFSNPGKALNLTVKKIFLFFDYNENPQSSIMDISFFRDNYSTLLKIPFPNFFAVFILSVFGIVLTFNKHKNFALVYLLAASYVLATVPFFIIGRFRVAITPIFIFFAAAGILKIYDIYKNKKFAGLIIPAAVAAAFLLIDLFYLPRFEFNPYDAYLNLGNKYQEEHQYSKALDSYKKSLQYNNYYLTYNQIGNTLAFLKDYSGAKKAFDESIKLKSDYALSHFNLGALYVQTNQMGKAYQAFLKAIEINPNFADAYRNIAIINYINGDYKKSLDNFEKYLSLTDDPEARASVQKDIEALKYKLGIKN